MESRDVRFGIQIVSDWPQMGQIWDFLRSVSVHFGSASQNVLKLILKYPTFVPFEANLTHFVAKPNIPALATDQSKNWFNRGTLMT